MRSTFRRGATALAAALVTATAMVAGLPAAVAEDTTTPSTATLADIRTGRHEHFDRIVLDLSGPAPGVVAERYVDQLTRAGSGRPVDIPGTTFLEITLAPAAAHDDSGRPTYEDARQFTTPDLHNVRAVAITGDYEDRLTLGIGVGHGTLHRVFTLDNPTRVVIDVGH